MEVRMYKQQNKDLQKKV